MAEVEKKTRTVRRMVTKEVEEQEEYYQLALSRAEAVGLRTLLGWGASNKVLEACQLMNLYYHLIDAGIVDARIEFSETAKIK